MYAFDISEKKYEGKRLGRMTKQLTQYHIELNGHYLKPDICHNNAILHGFYERF